MLAKCVLYTSVTCYNCACEDHDLWRGPYNNIQQCTQVKINKMVIRIPLLYLVEELTYDSFNMHWKQVFKLLSLHFNYSSPASLSLKLLWPVSHVLVPSLAFSQKKKVNIFGKFRFEEKIKNNKVPNRCSVFLRIWSDRGLWGYPRRQEGLCLHEQAQPRPSCRDTE